MKQYAIFDGHCDTAVELWLQEGRLADAPLHISLQRARDLEAYVQVFAFCVSWMPQEVQDADAFAKSLSYFSHQLSLEQDRIRLLRTAKDVEAVLHGGGRGAMLSIEGAEAIGCDPGRLEEVYEAGVRMVSLTWNHANALAGSCVTGEGLTAQGREFFRRAQKLGMIVDVSHLSDRAFWEMCDLAEKPIVASHSNSRAVCPHPRNLTDEQFRAICDLGGTAGINLCGAFLAEQSATFDDVCRHVDHFYALGGAGHVALGGDLDGCDGLPQGFTGVENYLDMAEALSAHGYSDADIQSIFSEALLGVVRRCVQ